MNARLNISLAWAAVTSLVVFIGCYILLAVVRENHINNMENHSLGLAHIITSHQSIHSYIQNPTLSKDFEKVKTFIYSLLEHDPFIDEISMFDLVFGKMTFRFSKSRDVNNPTDIPRAPTPSSDILESGEPVLSKNSWEFFVPVEIAQNNRAVLRIRWQPEATWMVFNRLKWLVFWIAGLTFVVNGLLAFFVFTKIFNKEQSRLAKALSTIVNGDRSNRIDTKSFTKGLSEIGVYFNKLLTETEQAKRTSAILDDTLRQTERGCSDYRRSLKQINDQLDSMRHEMREGMISLFDQLWCGVVIFDEDFQIHYRNDKSQQLLRFAKIENDYLIDDRLRGCLEPMVRLNTRDKIDDVCVWSQTTLNRPVSCRIRSIPVPAAEGHRLYFLLLKEEDGYPTWIGSSVFLERLILDCCNGQLNGQGLNDTTSSYHNLAYESDMQFQQCLKRIESLRNLEKGEVGPVRLIRFPQWLRNRFESEDLFSQYLHIDANTPDMDVQLRLPELLLSELIDSIVSIYTRISHNGANVKQNQSIIMRISPDSHGKPVLTIMLPHCSRNQAFSLKDVLEDRMNLACEQKKDRTLTLDELEHDICLSLFRIIKRLLHIQLECVYTESKRLATTRMTIEQHVFPPIDQNRPDAYSYKDTVRDLMRHFLSGVH